MCVFANILSLHANLCQPMKTSHRRTTPHRCKWTITWPVHDTENKYTLYCARKIIVIHILCILICGVWKNLYVEVHQVYHSNTWFRSSKQFVSILFSNGKFLSSNGKFSSSNGKFFTTKLMCVDIPCFNTDKYLCTVKKHTVVFLVELIRCQYMVSSVWSARAATI
jgi:hypothetical protein